MICGWRRGGERHVNKNKRKVLMHKKVRKKKDGAGVQRRKAHETFLQSV